MDKFHSISKKVCIRDLIVRRFKIKLGTCNREDYEDEIVDIE
jgi:hypothetical protein